MRINGSHVPTHPSSILAQGKPAHADISLYEGDKICQADINRTHRVLGLIADEGSHAFDGK